MFDPVKWGDGKKRECAEYLFTDITNAIGDRQALSTQWQEWLTQYRAPAKQPLKRFPYEGAANFMMPSTAIDVDQLYANELTTLHATDDLWSVSPLNERWVKAAKPLQDLLTWTDQHVLRMFDVNQKVILEKYKLGTAIYKTHWLYEKREVMAYSSSGKAVRSEKVRSQPVVDHVRLDDFLIPPYAWDIQPDNQGGAPWVAERMRIPTERLKYIARSQADLFPNFDPDALKKVIEFAERSNTQYQQKVHDLDYSKRPGVPQRFDVAVNAGTNDHTTTGSPLPPWQVELWQVHVRYPVGKTGDSPSDVILLFHLPTREVVHAIYQPYLFLESGVRPYDPTRMFPGDGFYGIGVCEQKEMFQKVESDLTNFMYDNVLLANSRVIVTRQGSNIMPGEAIYPWKIIATDGDPRETFGIFPMADIYESLPALIEMFREMGKLRTSVSDVQLGNIESLPGRTPATTMMSMLQEGKKRPDLSIKMSRYQGLSNVGLRVVQLLQQFATTMPEGEGQRYLVLAQDVLGIPEGNELVKALSFPLESAEAGVQVSLTATSASGNKEVDRQSKLALLQLAVETAPQVMGLVAQALQGQGTPLYEVGMASAAGIVELFKRVVESYDIRDVEQIVPEGSQDTSGAAASAGNLGGGVPGAGAPGGAPGMGQVPAALGAAPVPGGGPAAAPAGF